MVKQADHNSPLWKGQRGREGEFMLLQFHILLMQVLSCWTLDKFAMVSSSKYSSLYFVLLEDQ